MMFGLQANPIKKLEKAYAKKTAEALAAQRAGRMPEFAKLSSEAEELGQKLDQARNREV